MPLIIKKKINSVPPQHRISRETRDKIAGALTDIFVPSIETGKVPEVWRIAHFVALFNKGYNDKPVSLISVV